MTRDIVQARDAAIRAMLPLVRTLGWTAAAMKQAAGADADLLFPGGPPAMVAQYIDMADRDMVADSGAALAEQHISRRVRALILTRLEQALPHKQAVRRAMTVLALPANAIVAARCTYGTVDAIWRAAGDASTDASQYTKRGILAGVYGSTLLYWLSADRDQPDTLAFLDRRLADVARIGSLSRRLRGRLPPSRQTATQVRQGGVEEGYRR